MFINDALTANIVEEPACVVRLRRRRSSAQMAEPDVLPLPTDATPGTREKIAVLRARLEAGVRLHHPDDVRVAACWMPRTLRPMRFKCRD